MRVLFLLHAHPDLQAGGTEIFARDLFRTLRNQGVEGLFLAGTAAHQRPPSPGTPFQSVSGAPDEVLLWSGGFDPFFLSQIDVHGVAEPLGRLLAELQPDVIHIHHFLTLGVELMSLLRRFAPRARIVMTLHDYYAQCANDGQMVTTSGTLCHAARPDACRKCFPDRGLTDFKLRDLHIGAALAQVDQFISPSQFLRDRYIAWGLSGERITVLPNGFPSVPSAPLRRSMRRDRFAFFGHINRFKGATVALGASAQLTRAGVTHALSVHGSTEHQAETTVTRFEQALAAAPDSRYRGPYRRTEIPALMTGADWVIFPSEWWENAPLVINEAFQHRRPVICSALGGALELVHDGVNGLHFPVGDASALAEVMRRAIEEPGLWQDLVGRAEAPVSIEESAARHLALYNDLLCSPAPRRVA